jgi:predicted glycoside hydrolase/deacetylase ChbG (UPF0249 family)
MTRRGFLRSGLGGLAATLAAPALTRAALRDRFLIVNADDLGLSAEIDAGIFEAHDHGIVTSASLLVDAPDAEAAVREVRKRPKFGVGIHVAFDSRGTWLFDVHDLAMVERELERQIQAFVRLTGGPPDHINSHHHVHRQFNVAYLFLEAGRRYHVPVRGFSDVLYVAGFYGQPQYGKTMMSRVSVENLLALLQIVRPGVSELSCHPGHLESRPDAFYNRERVAELATLTDERIRDAIAAAGIRLINFRDYQHLSSG